MSIDMLAQSSVVNFVDNDYLWPVIAVGQLGLVVDSGQQDVVEALATNKLSITKVVTTKDC